MAEWFREQPFKLRDVGSNPTRATMNDNLPIYQIGDEVSSGGKKGVVYDVHYSRQCRKWLMCIRFLDGTKKCATHNNASVVKLGNTSSSKGE